MAEKKPKYTCSECGEEVEIKQIGSGNEEISCKKCGTTVTTLGGPIKKFVCLGECRGEIIIVPMNLSKKLERCPICQSTELYEIENPMTDIVSTKA